MKRLLAFLVFSTFGVILFVGVAKTVGWSEIQNVALEFSGFKGLTLLGLTSLVFVVAIVRWQGILRSQGHTLSFGDLWKSYLGGFTLSFFTPMIFFGAELFRAHAIEELHRVPFQKAMASTIVERLLEGTVYLLFIFLTVFFVFSSPTSEISRGWAWIVFLVVLLGSALLFFYTKSFRKQSILRMFFPRLPGTNGFLEIENEVFSFFKWNNRAFWAGLAFSFLKGGIVFARSLVLLSFLGKSLAAIPAFSATGFTFLSLLLPIPGQLGSHEALQAFMFQAFGMGASSGAAFALLIRGAEVIIALVGLWFLIRLGALLFRRVLLGRLERILHHFVS